MPKYLKLFARYINSGLIAMSVLFVVIGIGRGDFAMSLVLALLGVVFAFNLYLIEKSAMLLSEEEWLKSEVRKVFLRRKLARLAKEDATQRDAQK